MPRQCRHCPANDRSGRPRRLDKFFVKNLCPGVTFTCEMGRVRVYYSLLGQNGLLPLLAAKENDCPAGQVKFLEGMNNT